MKMMKNENVKVVKSEKVWKPNENQRAFLEALKGYEAPVSLMEIAVDTGVRFASGVVTPLVKRDLVVVPSYVAKGLEFDSVIIYTDEDNKYQEKDKYLFYVACTRAQHNLIIYNNSK